MLLKVDTKNSLHIKTTVTHNQRVDALISSKVIIFHISKMEVKVEILAGDKSLEYGLPQISKD